MNLIKEFAWDVDALMLFNKFVEMMGFLTLTPVRQTVTMPLSFMDLLVDQIANVRIFLMIQFAGLMEEPIEINVCCVATQLGRNTMDLATSMYKTASAIHNMLILFVELMARFIKTLVLLDVCML